jgi:hypothetical protein
MENGLEESDGSERRSLSAFEEEDRTIALRGGTKLAEGD